MPWLLRIWRQLPTPVRQRYLRVRYGGFAVGIAGITRDQDGRIFMVHRTYSRDEPWALPGGWLERSDGSPGSALQREMQEETGLRVRVGPVLAIEHAGFAIVVLLAMELVDSVDSFRRSPEISDVAWIEPSRVRDLSPMNARLLRQITGGAGGGGGVEGPSEA